MSKAILFSRKSDYCQNVFLIASLSLLIGNVNPRGALYVNLIFESLLGAFPCQGVQLFIDGKIANNMICACAANYHNNSDCEPDRVIIIYLSVLARLLLHTSNVLDNIIPFTCKEGLVFGHDHLVMGVLKKPSCNSSATHRK